MRRLLAIAALTVASYQAHASKIIGNGGMVVVCTNPTSVQLLDFYEAENLHYDAKGMVKLTMYDPDGADYQSKVSSLIARISKRFPLLAQDINTEFQNFLQHNLIIPNVDLGDTDDDFHSVLPKGCHVQQIAIQRPPMFPRDAWFTISKDLWDALDERGKAGLALHEVIYRLGVKNGLEHSIGVRYLVGLLFSREIDQISDQDWISALQQTRIKNYEVEGVTIPLFTGQFNACERLPGNTACERASSTFKAAEVHYNRGGRLQQVTYPDMPEVITLSTLNGAQSKLRVWEMRFDWSRDDLTLIGKGDLLLTAMESWMEPVTLSFNGQITPNVGQFQGTLQVLDLQGRAVSDKRDFTGSLWNMLAGVRPPSSAGESKINWCAQGQASGICAR